MTEFYEYKSTMHGLNKWYEHSFEKLGWIVLLMNKLPKEAAIEKMQYYYNGLIHLKNSLENKIKNTIEIDKKNDLEILLSNTIILINFFVKLTSYDLRGGAKKSSKKK